MPQRDIHQSVSFEPDPIFGRTRPLVYIYLAVDESLQDFCLAEANKK
jgi:hypothetical protein